MSRKCYMIPSGTLKLEVTSNSKGSNKGNCWANFLSSEERENILERKLLHKQYLAARSDGLKERKSQLNNEVKRMTSECKSREINKKLKTFQGDPDERCACKAPKEALLLSDNMFQ